MFARAGLSRNVAFALTVVQYGLGILATLLSFKLLTILNRRTLHLSGLLSGFLLLLSTGTIASLPLAPRPQAYTIGILLLLFATSYNLSIGPATYPLINEIPSTRMRAKTLSCARFCYLAVSLFNGGVTPLMLAPAPDGLDWGAKSAFFWAGTTVLCLAFVYFCVPETRGRSYAEIEGMFREGVGARESVGWVPRAGIEVREQERRSGKGGGEVVDMVLVREE